MKRIFLSMFIAALGLGFTATAVEAKRLGGGMSQGMKRQAPPPQKSPDTPQQAPQQNATPAAPANAAAPAAAPRRAWMGPVAGLAAGLGIAALASHLGFGEGLANIMTIVLLALVAFFVIRFLLRRFGPKPAGAPGMQFAGAGSAGNVPLRDERFGGAPGAGTAFAPAVQPAVGASRLPAGFDAASFERAAKMIFIRMQAANDSGDLDDLRKFSTPEMFAAFRLDLQDRRDAKQRTDVVQLDAQAIDWAEEDGQQIVSVRFHGLVREEENGVATPFDEVWHLVRPVDGSREWAIAGIQQS